MHPAIIVAVTILPSLGLIKTIESVAESHLGRPLSKWRRWLIPIPIFVLLISNLFSCLYERKLWLGLLLHIPKEENYRSPQWDLITFMAGLAMIIILPFLLCPLRIQSWKLTTGTWIGHFLWIFFPYSLWLSFFTSSNFPSD